MTCSHCAAEMPDISAFCPVCGRSVSAPEILIATDRRDAFLGALAYVTVAPAIVFLAVSGLKSSRFVRFHSWQSVFFGIATAVTAVLIKVLFAIFSILPGIGFLLAWLSVGIAFIAIVVAWVALAVKALQGRSYELPLIGHIAAQLAD
jgi:uncharacterized membrane protein